MPWLPNLAAHRRIAAGPKRPAGAVQQLRAHPLSSLRMRE